MNKNVYLPLIIVALIAGRCHARSSVEAERVRFCELIEDPARYNGARVSVMAAYSYGYEWQELLCTECHSKGRTWLMFRPGAVDRIRKQLKKAPRHQGVVAGLFTGVFRGTGGPYGDGSFRFEFQVESVSDVRVLIRDWKTPLDQLPACKSMAGKN